MDAVEVGMKLHAEFTDGEYYPAEVLSVSESKKRAKAPVKIHYVGYGTEDDAWLPLASLKSKKLPKASAATPKRQARPARSKGSGLPKEGIKLYYWPATGKAQAIRFCFAEAGVEWEDVSFEKEKPIGVYSSPTSLLEIKETDNYKAFCEKCRELGGNLTTNTPMLELEGKFYTQSHAIYRLVARKTGLYPKKIEDGYVVDNILAHVEDARTPNYQVLMGGLAKEKYLKEAIPAHLGNLERLLGDSEFFLPGAFTIADILVFDLLHSMYAALVPTVLEDYPKLSGLYERVAGREKIKEYLASEKCTKMDKFVPLA